MNFARDSDLIKSLVDIYQIKSSPAQGFKQIKVGTLPSEKVQGIFFSGTGNVLCTVEGDMPSKSTVVFYMISKISNEGQTAVIVRTDQKYAL